MRVKRTDLTKALDAVSPGLSAREVVDQSAHFVFRGGRVATFNDEVACSAESPVPLEGAVVAAPLTSLLRKLTEEYLDVEAGDGELLVKGDKRRSGIRMEAEVRLPLEGIEAPGDWRPAAESLVSALRLAASCVSRDQSQFTLCCVHVAPAWVEACDNFQLIRVAEETGVEFLARGAALAEVAETKPSEWSATENWLHFRGGSGVVMSCRRYSDAYPDLGAYLEVSGEKMRLPKGIDGALDKAVIFGDRKDAELLTVELKRGKLKLTARGPDGWYSQMFPSDYSGEAFSFRVAPRLLLEIVSRSEEVTARPGRLAVESGAWRYVTCTSDAGEG